MKKTYIREILSDVVFMITVLYSATEAIAMTIGAGNAENTETRVNMVKKNEWINEYIFVTKNFFCFV